MNDYMLVKIHQQELRDEADRERLVRLARSGQKHGLPTVDRPSMMARLRTLAAALRRPQPPVDNRTGAA